MYQYLEGLPPYPHLEHVPKYISNIKPILGIKTETFVPTSPFITLLNTSSVPQIVGSLNFSKKISTVRYQEHLGIGEFGGVNKLSKTSLKVKEVQAGILATPFDIDKVAGDRGGGNTGFYNSKELVTWVKYYSGGSYTGSKDRKPLMKWLHDAYDNGIIPRKNA